MLISLVELQSRNILRMVAFQEIFLLPFSVFMIFAGKTSLATPFLYYRFLSMRYSSRRNPYCRTICHELRLAVEALAYNPKCPGWAKNVIYKVKYEIRKADLNYSFFQAITAVSNLAPATEAQ